MSIKPKSSITYTRRRLKLWAHWCHAITTQGLDYSHQSTMATIVKYGGFIAKSTASNTYPINSEAETINELIEKLGETDKELVQLLRLHYVTEGKVKDKFQRIHLSGPTYFRQLNKAIRWIDEHLQGSNYTIH